MAALEPKLKTRQVAEALGVSVSTVKRWVDAGEIRAERTVGKHRLIPLSEAERFARENDLRADFRPFQAAGAGGEAPERPAIDERLRDELASALCAGRAALARRLIRDAFDAAGAVELADEVVRPVMERIGHRWQFDVLDIYQEHRATHLVESALRELVQQEAPPADGPLAAPLALGATPEGDPYTLNNLLIELALRERGWQTMNLGPNLPLPSLAVAVKQNHPRLAWLSVNHLADPAGFAHAFDEFQATAARVGAAVILGGPALGPEVRGRLAATNFGERIADLADFAHRLYPRPAAS